MRERCRFIAIHSAPARDPRAAREPAAVVEKIVADAHPLIGNLAAQRPFGMFWSRGELLDF